MNIILLTEEDHITGEEQEADHAQGQITRRIPINLRIMEEDHDHHHIADTEVQGQYQGEDKTIRKVETDPGVEYQGHAPETVTEGPCQRTGFQMHLTNTAKVPIQDNVLNPEAGSQSMKNLIDRPDKDQGLLVIDQVGMEDPSQETEGQEPDQDQDT